MEERNNKTVRTQTSLSFGTISVIVTIVFVILKLCHVIDWGWVFVFLPVIISTGIGVVALLIALTAMIILYFMDKHDRE